MPYRTVTVLTFYVDYFASSNALRIFAVHTL